MGILTAVFSIGRFLSSLLFGWMCDGYSFKSVYILSSIICVAGNVLYLMADVHVAHSRTLLAFSRFVVGFGAGNRSVCRANVAAMTSVHARLRYITILSTVVFLGYALTPGVGSYVAHWDFFVTFVHINKFTAPGLLLIFLNAGTLLAIIALYDESVSSEHAPLDSAQVTLQVLTKPTAVPERLVYQGLAVFIILNFNARGILSVFETVNVPLYLQVTGQDPGSQSAVIRASTYQFYLGCLGLLSYLSILIFRHRITDVNWLQIGFTAMAVGNIILSIEPSRMDLDQFTVGEILVWSIGCPLTAAVVVATFSKILGGRPQGTLMGLLGAAGSVSRMVLPLLPAVVTSYSPLFVINTFLCVASCVALKWYNDRILGWKSGRIQYPKDVLSPLIVKQGSRKYVSYLSPPSPRSPLHAHAQN